MYIPKVIFLYDEGIKDLSFRKIKEFIRRNFSDIKVRQIKLKKEAVKTHGLLFDFINTQKAFDKLPYSKTKDACHIILTPKIFATVEQDKRPHIRASIYSFPSIISTSGIVEGPAKPREYYLYKQKYSQLGIWEKEEAELKQRFKGRFIDYGDKRITEVLKGYIAQAIFFYIIGEPFCKNKNCRLFNAHWQEDLIYTQIKRGEFCTRHKRVLKNIKKNA